MTEKFPKATKVLITRPPPGQITNDDKQPFEENV